MHILSTVDIHLQVKQYLRGYHLSKQKMSAFHHHQTWFGLSEVFYQVSLMETSKWHIHSASGQC